MDAQEIFKCLTPELALAGFADGEKEYERSENVFHAYCASYMLCKKYGIDTQDFRFEHAPKFFEGMEPQEVRAELSKARNAVNKISSRMAKVLEQERSQNRQPEREEQDRPSQPPREWQRAEPQQGSQGYPMGQSQRYAREDAR